MLESCIEENIQKGSFSELRDICLVNFIESDKQLEHDTFNVNLLFDSCQTLQNDDGKLKFEELGIIEKIEQQEAPKLELKPLPEGLRYAYLGEEQTYPVVISSTLSNDQESKLLSVFKNHKNAIGWTLNDIKFINPLIYTHRINLEENAKTCQQTQRRLNPHMKEVVKTEVFKLLDAGIIYLDSDSKCVCPTQVVPKKSGITVVKNEKGELIPTRITFSWCMCIDSRKLNEDTRKDHFPLPFLDQILERVVGHPY